MSADDVRALLPPSRDLGADGPLIVGIVNVTPDSFSDGGRFVGTADAIEHGVRLWEEGADWLDVGGESTRPGAAPVDPDDELLRVVPVIAGLAARLPDAVISVDTRRAAVAAAALEAGASVVNDVSAGGDRAMLPLVAARGARIVLMHHRGTPETMQTLTHYEDLVGDVARYLSERARAATVAGVPRGRVILDPGLGFAKSSDDNPRLIAAVPRLRELGLPVLIGASRKGFVGRLTGVGQAAERVHGSVGAALAAASRGADLLRVHDVAATIQALRVYRACLDA
jgi:dihydropteroate synthase